MKAWALQKLILSSKSSLAEHEEEDAIARFRASEPDHFPINSNMTWS